MQKGEIFGLLGPNGAGKTTTIRMLVGLAKPTTGSIHICGHDMQTARRLAMQEIGTIVENPELYPYLSGLENLNEWSRS
ncbi:ABC-2 type transport system ATP-binding protein [Paenibacillus taihuensis]|uniref:ABC-2 type transport system ATP-binding protein n=1 Tax=Paenibacillus taihuensis TaxID=1156355 RepID=A0A3D9SL11_9BACL|nr:ABC-2 type transport system ATP-binding protein [Paenibacillus taihuensis]